MTIAPFNSTTAANVWLNADGLVVKFGTTEGRIDDGGELGSDGNVYTTTELRINATEISTTSGTLVGTGYNTGLPMNAQVVKIEVYPEVACTGTGAVLNLGIAQSNNFTLVGATALINGLPLSQLSTAGKLYTIGQGAGDGGVATYAGTYVGSNISTTQSVVLTMDNGGTAFTAGKILVRIYYYVPDVAVAGESNTGQ